MNYKNNKKVYYTFIAELILKIIIFAKASQSIKNMAMDGIKMVDLKRQYLSIKDEIDTAIGSVLESTAFIRGEELRLFESDLANYLKVKHVIGCGNGTDAMQVALMALDLKPGDEIITTNFTFIATVEVIALLGLVPVLVEPDPGTFNISPEAIEAAITKHTRVILPVHLFGQCANIAAIRDIASLHNLYIIEDTAQALGADYIFPDGSRKKAGTMGTIGTSSFFPSKNLGCYGDGGAIFTDNDKLASRIRSIVNHGMTERYYHEYIGVNSRLDTLQAAILKVKLKYLNLYNNARQDAAHSYDIALKQCKEITIPERSDFSNHIFHQYTIKLDPSHRDKLKDFLQQRSIPSMIYYPVPLNRQKAYSSFGFKDTAFPLTDNLSETVLSLPMHTELKNKEIELISSTILEYFKEN